PADGEWREAHERAPFERVQLEALRDERPERVGRQLPMQEEQVVPPLEADRGRARSNAGLQPIHVIAPSISTEWSTPRPHASRSPQVGIAASRRLPGSPDE